MKKTTTSTNKSSTTAKTNSTSTNASANLSDNSKIAVVDIQALVSQTPSVLALRQERQNQIAGLQQWVNGANAEINQQTDQNAKAALFQKYQLEFNQRQQMLQTEYVQKVQSIDAELSKLIADVAKKEKLDYVFAKGIVVFGGTDITSKVAEMLKK
jgi:Skp family chaperone for outer membrane proteins